MSSSPAVKKMSFADATKFMIEGCRVTRRSWNDEKIYLMISGEVVHIFRDGALRPLMVSVGDLLGDDWEVC